MSDSIAVLDGIESGAFVESRVGRRISRRLVLSRLRGLQRGALQLIEKDRQTPLGQRWDDAETRARLEILDPRCWPKLVARGSIGAAESYVAGFWDADDLPTALRLFLLNRDALFALDGGNVAWRQPLRRLAQRLRANTRRGSRRNIGAHYDLSNDFFGLFLDRQMMYSAAVFERPELATIDDLDAASERKLALVADKLALKPTDHLLEIGTGWGGMALWAASRHGCRVTTTTISREQYDAARARVRAAGLEDRVEVLLKDYRDLRGTFDKLVSIEMIEAVGHDFLPTYFSRCAELLRPDGRMVLQAITLADRNYESARRKVDFIQRYIFPGSQIPSVGAMVAAIAKTDLTVRHLEDIGPHYAATLRLWRQRFEANDAAVQALGFDRRFRRLWRYYLAYCEAGFLEREIGDVQMVLAKPGDRLPARVGPIGSSEPR
ncbi:MAG: cyclopropane-fatty-acyl-phospholipid synthase family protein [Acidobacteriota bacterium]